MPRVPQSKTMDIPGTIWTGCTRKKKITSRIKKEKQSIDETKFCKITFHVISQGLMGHTPVLLSSKLNL